MKAEMDSMDPNSVWELVDLPKGIKLIVCRWINNEKRNTGGKVKTYKARHVAKGYTQKEDIDYEKNLLSSCHAQVKPHIIIHFNDTQL
ncbi:hypothetical protein PVK06_008900 [Gossypium arboreum]|uniref:Reverse transcriptase Ty1/copia-type domain-containing protein n=1 Tax=Gossypium arboreum TaxID=29729 RepID=A0ABR0QM62_GOSAR|nr:hypothetical protein PVK06_008900 [Gossypium arboreum]